MAKIRHEINLMDGIPDTGITAATLTDIEGALAYFDASLYSGTITARFEAVFRSPVGTAVGAVTVALRDTSDNTLASVSNAGAGNYEIRTADFSLSASTAFKLSVSSDGTHSVMVSAARIVVFQTVAEGNVDASSTIIELGDYGHMFSAASDTALTYPRYWKYNSANWDGTVTGFFEAVFKASTTKYTATVTLQVDSAGGFTGWANVANAVVTTSAATATRVRSAVAFTPTAGRNYRIVVKSSSTKSTNTLFAARIIICQAGPVTKIEEQYLIAPEVKTGTTVRQQQYANWQPTDWSDVAITGSFAADGGASNSSVVYLQNSTGSTTYATVGGTWGYQGVASIASMPAGAVNFDFYASPNISLFGARILVAGVITISAPTTSIKAVGGVPYASIAKVSGVAKASMGKVAGLS